MSALAAVVQRFKPASNKLRIGPIGLECSRTEIHLVQMQATTDHVITVCARASLAYPESREEIMASPNKFRALVRKVMAADHFRGNRVATTIPSADVQIMQVPYHLAEGQSNNLMLLEALKERVDGDLNDFVIDSLPVRSKTRFGEQLAIVAIAPQQTVLHYLELLRKSGLAVESLEIGPAAIRRVISAMGPRDQHANVLAINFGRDQSYLTVVSGARLLLDQSVRIGENTLLAGISTALDMPVDSVRELVNSSSADLGTTESQTDDGDIDIAGTLQEIMRPILLKFTEEINRVLVYTASETHGQSVNQIYLMGSLARWPGMAQLLGSLVKLPVQTIPDPLEPFCQANGSLSTSSQPRPEILIATGMALTGMLENDGY